jgi:hypothetical protein
MRNRWHGWVLVLMAALAVAQLQPRVPSALCEARHCAVIRLQRRDPAEGMEAADLPDVHSFFSLGD